MADLKEMTERVVERERETIRQEVEKKRQEAEQEVSAVQEKIERQRLQEKESIEAEINEEYTIQENTLEIQQRNNILASKQDIINKVLSDARGKLNSLGDKEFQDFVLGAVNQFANEEKVEIILGEKSRGKVTQEWLDRQQFSNLEAILSEDHVKNKAGIIVKQGGIEYNFLFDELIDSLKDELVSKISQKLFN